MTEEVGPARKKFFTSLKHHLLKDDFEEVNAAYEMSKYGHYKQVRDDGTRYFDHPRAVATILFEELGIYDHKMIVAALLHDIIEDSHMLSEGRIAINFGSRTALWVKYLTKEEGMNFDDYFNRLQKDATWEIMVIKLCDRLHNLRELGNCTEKKQKKQVAETREYYIPLADQLTEMFPKEKRHIGEYLRDKITKECCKYS